MRTTSKLVIAVALIAGSTVAASAADGYPGDGDWGDPDSCVDPDTYTFSGETDTCALMQVLGNGTECTYSCPHVPATVYKYTEEG